MQGINEATQQWYDLCRWYEALEPVKYQDLPSSKGLVVTDMVNGFCREGTLASERVGALVDPIARLASFMYKQGTRAFLSIQDTHRPDSVEFKSYPAHCIQGTDEAELVDELKFLTSSSAFPWKVFEKDTLTAGFTRGTEKNPGLNDTLLGLAQKRNPMASTFEHPCNIQTLIVAGNCTDLCVYQAAMHIKQWYGHNGIDMNVVVPVNLVETYDAPGHNAIFYNIAFLNHMAQNGITVVKEIQ